jgi:hypothetical protein
MIRNTEIPGRIGRARTAIPPLGDFEFGQKFYSVLAQTICNHRKHILPEKYDLLPARKLARSVRPHEAVRVPDPRPERAAGGSGPGGRES